MRLKRLELKGFKSFAKETVIHFNEDITGVVGPNGSGKSNVVDAIRWVLGEQKTTELRLDRMADVLFNGTKKRKPAQLAKVSVTFDNDKGLIASEYSELTITRILYRSGDSEYRLNDVSCRLKDIRSILMDTGIGSNTYAIIALGMVDDILSDKDQARRKMFEQAAGISKFKMRKRETLLKLKNADQDLDRVEDLLHEIEGNLKRLKKEAKQAEKYLDLKKEYKICSIDAAIIRSKKWRAEYKELEGKILSEKTRLEEIAAQIVKRQSLVEEKKRANLNNELVVSENQKNLSALVQRIRELEGQIEMRKQRVSYNKRSLDRTKDQIALSRTKIKEVNVDLEKLSDQMKSEESSFKEMQAELEQTKSQKEKVDAQYADVKIVRNQRLEQQQQWEQQKVQWEKQIAVAESQVIEMQRQLSRIQEESSQELKQLHELKGQEQYLRKQYEDHHLKFETLKSSEEARKQKVEELQKGLEESKEELQKVFRLLDARQNDYELTKSLVENLEGFPESARFLKKNNKWKNDAPLFSDIIFCDEAYRGALENFLEPYLSFFIVGSPQEALQGIQLLKDAQKGKAHFLIHSGLSQSKETPALIGAEAAIHKLEVDPMFQDLVESLLVNVYFLEEEQMASQMIKEYPEAIFLSKDGTVIWRKNHLSGGSAGLFEGKRIGRKKNLEKLNTQITKLKAEGHQWEKKIHQFKQDIEAQKTEQLDLKIEEAQSKKQELEKELHKAEISIESLQNNQSKSQARKDELEREITARKNQIAELRNKIIALDTQLQSVKSEAQQADLGFNKVAEESSRISEAYNQLQIETLRKEARVQQLKSELAYKERRKKELEQEENSKIKEQQELNEAIQKDQKDQHTDEDRLAVHYQEKKDKQEALSEVERVYFQARNEISELEKQLSKDQHAQQQQQELIYQLKDRFNEVKLELRGISERLQVEFEISINQVIDQPTSKEWELNELKEHLEHLRHRLSRLGDVNPMAVEAYNEMKERHDLIAEQRQDIIDAQVQLKKTITEIEKTATDRFMAAFSEIRTHFIDVFRTLFTEDDTADLVLVNEEDPLDSNIEIIAKPKGKRPKSLSQLSGGEKTLTATALLFALYLLKPAPFCIFDEVDAPLDDANIEKFNKIIKRFSQQSQFIIVTHNKSTMAAVDVIYGVYMNEPGLSGVSAVDFRNLAHQSLLEAVNN